jgi:two-component system, NarL family, nitrate/nitrite response regulator NarL
MEAKKIAVVLEAQLWSDIFRLAIGDDDTFQVIDLEKYRTPDDPQWWLEALEQEKPDLVVMSFAYLANNREELVELSSDWSLSSPFVLFLPGIVGDVCAREVMDLVGSGKIVGVLMDCYDLKQTRDVLKRIVAGNAEIPIELVQRALKTITDCRSRGCVEYLDRLTIREFEVLELVRDGLSNKQIATRLCLSIYTVKNHVHNIIEKLHVENRHGAACWLRQAGKL